MSWLVSMIRWLFGMVGCLFLVMGTLRCSSSQGRGPAVSIQPKGGKIPAGTLIRLKVEREAKIYYTLDETSPNPDFSLRYSGPFRLWSTTTIRFVAVDSNKLRGPEGKAAFRIDALFPETQASPLGGNYRGSLFVTITSDEKGQIRYTLDGSEPTLQSPVYQKPLLLRDDTTLRYFGVDESGNREPLQKQVYNFPPVLTVTPGTGVFHKRPVTVEIKSNDRGASVFYHVVELPQRGWLPYKKPLSFLYDTWLQVRAHDKQGWSAEVQTFLYALIRPLSQSLLFSKAPKALAAVSVDLEGFDRPGLVMATKDALVVVTSKEDVFQPPQRAAPLSFETAWIRSWDLNGDGLNDIVLGDKKNKLHLFLAKSGRTLKEDNALLAVLSKQEVRSVVPLDYNGDGQLDLFLLDRRKGESRLVKRTSEGYKLQPPLQWKIESGALGALAGDFNNDGVSDLFLLPGQQRAPYLLLGNRQGGFKRVSFADILSSVVVPPSIQWLHAARSDLDGDGDLDILLIGRAPPTNRKVAILYVVLLHHLDGPYWKTIDVTTLPDAPIRGCALADFDSDGYPDLVLWHRGKEPILLNNVLGQRMFVVSKDKLPAAFSSVGVATVGPNKNTGTHALWWANGADWQRLLPKGKSRFLHLLLQGYRGNRNAIDAKILIKTETTSWLRQIGIRSTGPDQTSLFLPIPFDNNTTPKSIKIRWSDSQIRDIPHPPLSQPIVIRPN